MCTVGTALAALYYQSPEPNSALAHWLFHQCVAPNVLHQMYCFSVLHYAFCTKCIAPVCCTKYFALVCWTKCIAPVLCTKYFAPVCCTKCFAPVFCTKCIDRLHSHSLHQGWLHFFHTKKSTRLFFHQQQQPISFLPRKEFDQPGLFGHRITCRRQPPLKQSIKRWGNSTHRSTVSGKKDHSCALGEREVLCTMYMPFQNLGGTADGSKQTSHEQFRNDYS